MHAPPLSEVLVSVPFEPQCVRVVDRGGEGPIVHAVRVWPSPRSALYGLVRGRWVYAPVCAAGSLLASPYDSHPDEAELDGWDRDLRALLAPLPESVREAIAPLSRVYAWKVLEMLGALPDLIELARDAPTLAGLLAFLARDDRLADPFEKLSALVGEPRHRLLPLLGLPSSRWVLRALSRIPPKALRDPGDEAVIAALATQDRETRRRLQHLPALPPAVVEILADPLLRKMTTFGLLAEPAPRDCDLPSQLGDLSAAGCTRRFRSQVAVRAAWDELAERRRNEWKPADHAGAFEPPAEEVTLPGEPPLFLRPLRNAQEMRQHGIEQDNCIPGQERYPRLAAGATGAMYVAKRGPGEPEITVWVERGCFGGWRLAEAAGPHNALVDQALRERLERWAESLPSDFTNADVDPPVGPTGEPIDLHLCLDPAVGSAGFLVKLLSIQGVELGAALSDEAEPEADERG